MSLRWRCDGTDKTLVCGAKSNPRDSDTYIDDRLHYHLSLTGVIEPDEKCICIVSVEDTCCKLN